MKSKTTMVSNAVLVSVLAPEPGVVDRVNAAVRGNEALLLFTGAKAYHVRGGLWRISGYADDGSDVDRVISKTKEKR
jgi:hypothetical protein